MISAPVNRLYLIHMSSASFLEAGSATKPFASPDSFLGFSYIRLAQAFALKANHSSFKGTAL